MKKMIFLCLMLNGCYVYQYPPNYVCQSCRPTYVQAPVHAPVSAPVTSYAEVPTYAPASASAPKVITRTVKRTVQIVPASQLKGVIK